MEKFFYSFLPPVLSEEELKTLFYKFYEGNYEAREKIIMSNLRLVLFVVRKYSNLDYEEAVSIGSLGLIKAVDTFKIEKNTKFSVYATQCIKNEIFMHYRKNKKHMQCGSLDTILYAKYNRTEFTYLDTIVSRENIIEDIESEYDYQRILLALKELDQDEQTIFKMYYGIDYNQRYNQTEIAVIFNTSRPNVSKKLSRIKIKILNKLSNKPCSKKRTK